MTFKFRELVKCDVDDLIEQEVIDLFLDSVKTQTKVLVGFANVAKSIDCAKNEELRLALNRSDYIIADGIGICVAAALLCKTKLTRLTGVDLFEKFIQLAATRDYRIYFLGGTPEVNRELKMLVGRTYSGNHQVSGRDGYFSSDDWDLVVDEINECKPDILFVGMSSPMKEVFLARYKDVLDVNFMMGVGGAFDVYTGKVKRAPVLTQRLGLEWLIRALREPHRIRRNFGAVICFIFQLSSIYFKSLSSFNNDRKLP